MLHLLTRTRLRRRAPRRLQDPQARRGQRCQQAILEIPQRERVEEVRGEAKGWHVDGEGEAVSRCLIVGCINEGKGDTGLDR
jgi:hypothetical protein